MPLKLSLKPGEKFVLNGAVVQNGDRRSALLLQNKASVLREKDIMQEEEANTPARRIYFPVMMMYLDEAGADQNVDVATVLPPAGEPLRRPGARHLVEDCEPV